MSLDLHVVPSPHAESLLEGLEGAGDERYFFRESLVATILLVHREGELASVEVGVSGHDVDAAARARGFEELLTLLEGLGPVYDARDGRQLVGAARTEAIRDFAGD